MKKQQKSPDDLSFPIPPQLRTTLSQKDYISHSPLILK